MLTSGRCTSTSNEGHATMTKRQYIIDPLVREARLVRNDGGIKYAGTRRRSVAIYSVEIEGRRSQK